VALQLHKDVIKGRLTPQEAQEQMQAARKDAKAKELTMGEAVMVSPTEPEQPRSAELLSADLSRVEGEFTRSRTSSNLSTSSAIMAEELAKDDFSEFRTPDGAWATESQASLMRHASSPRAEDGQKPKLQGRLARLEDRIAALEARKKGHVDSSPTEWFEVVENWAKRLDEVVELQNKVNAQRELLSELGELACEVWMERLGLADAGWARRLQKKWVDQERFKEISSIKVDDFVGLLMPALEMVRAMSLCTTPVQKVRLWTESILEAANLIQSQTNSQLGGDDLPSLVLFLVCHADCEDLVAQVEVARVFMIDLDGGDPEQFSLHKDGLHIPMESQYVFDAEQRYVDPSHYFMWVNDALRILSELDSELDDTRDLAAEEIA